MANGTEATIDLERQQLENADGSVSTELSVTIEADGEHFNIPTIVGGQRLSTEDAIAAWERGDNPELGRFDSLEEAEAAAKARSRRIGEALEAIQPRQEGYPPQAPEGAVAAPGAAPMVAPGGAPATTALDDQLAAWARATGQLQAPRPAAPGRPGAAVVPLPVAPTQTWEQRRAEADYQSGSVETRQKIQADWYREWEAWGDKYYKKKADQREFKDKLYEAVPREQLPQRTWIELGKEMSGRIASGSVGMGRGMRWLAERMGMDTEADPNSIGYLFTEKGSAEIRDAFMTTQASERTKEIAKIEAERLQAQKGQGIGAWAAAQAKFYKDYPEMLGLEIVDQVPLIAGVMIGGTGAAIASLPILVNRVRAGVITGERAAKILGAAQTAGMSVPYGTQFGSETYDSIRHALQEVPKAAWERDPIYQEAKQRAPEKTHAQLVEGLSHDRALWPSMLGGVLAPIIGVRGLEKVMVGPASARIRDAIGNQVARNAAQRSATGAGAKAALVEPTGEVLEQIYQDGVENARLYEIDPKLAKWEEMGASAVKAAAVSLGPGVAAGGGAALQQARENAAIVAAAAPAPGTPGAAPAAPGAPGAPPGPPGAPGAAPTAAGPAGAPGAPGAAGATAAPAADLGGRILQATAKVGEDAFHEGLTQRLDALPPEATEQQRESVMGQYVDELLGPPAGQPPGPPGPPGGPPTDLQRRYEKFQAATEGAAGFREGSAAAREQTSILDEIDAERARRGLTEDQPLFPGDPRVVAPLTPAERAAQEERRDLDFAKPRPAAPAPAAPAAPAEPVEPAAFALSKPLSKIAPRYGYKDRNFEVEFANDFDRATYTLAQQPKNKRHDAILNELLDTGLTEPQLIAHGRSVRGALKGIARDAPKGATKVKVAAIVPPTRMAPEAKEAAETATAAERAARSEAAAEREKKKQAIDPVRDSLFTAIAKLGGMNRAAAESEWGVDPKDPLPAQVFGLPVLRKDGGDSIDGMAERLVGWGYLKERDLAEFERKFDEERRGNKQYTPEGEDAVAAATSDAEAQARAEAEAEAAAAYPIAEAAELTPEELASTGYFDLNSDEQRAAEALVASLRGRFAGTESENAIENIIERAAIAAEADPDPAAFRRAIIAQLREEVGRGRPAQQPASPEGEPTGPGREEADEAARGPPEGQAPAGPAAAEAVAPAEAPAPGVAEPAPSPMRAAFEAKRAALKAKEAGLVTAAQEQGGLLLAQQGVRGRRLLLTPSLTQEGGYRVTSFIDDEPSGHREYDTLEQAVGEFMPKNTELEPLPEGVLPTGERLQAIKEARDEMAAELERRAALAPPAKRNAKKRKDVSDAISEAADSGKRVAQQGVRRSRAGEAAAAGAEPVAGVELPAQRPEGEQAPKQRPARGVKRPARKRGSEGEGGGPARTAAIALAPLPREWARATIIRSEDSAELTGLRERLLTAIDALEAVREANREAIASAADPEAVGVEALRKADAARARVETALAAVENLATFERARQVRLDDTPYIRMLQARMESSIEAADTALTEFRSFAELTAKTAERTDEEVKMLQGAKEALLRDRKKMRETAREWAAYIDTARRSQALTKRPSSVAGFKKAIADYFGIKPGEVDRRLPRVFIVSENEIYDGDKLTVTRGGKTFTMEGISPDEAAFYHWDENVIVFFPERSNKGGELEAFEHEAFHKRGEQFLGVAQMDRFRKEFESWRNSPRGSPERLIYGAVQRRVEVAAAADTSPLTKEARAAEELLPYAMSEARARGYSIDPKAILRPGVRGWLARIAQAFKRAFMRVVGMKPEDGASLQFTVKDLMTMAWGAAHLELDAAALEAIASGKPLPKGTKLVGIEAARKALESRPIFGRRVSELLTGTKVYVPEMTPARLRRFKLRYFETPTGAAALAAANKAELAQALEAAGAAPAPGPANPAKSSIIFKQPSKAAPIRTRKDLADYVATKRRPSTPWLPVLKEWVAENVADNQRPFFRWLEEHNLGTKAWDRLKLVTGRLRERAAVYKREILDPLSRDMAGLAKSAGVTNEQAALDVGWWATLRHVPEANRAIQMKLVRRIAAGDRSAIGELRRFAETQAGLHPGLNDPDRGGMAGGITDAEAASHNAQLIAQYTPQQRAEIERIADKIVAAFGRLKNDALASGQISPQAAAQFPNFQHYVAMTGANAPLWDTDQSSDAFGSYIAENRLRGREGRGGDTVSESAIESLAERIGRVAAYYASVPFKQELNDIYLRSGGPNNAIGLERMTANLVQQPQHSDIVWTAPSGQRYIYRFNQSTSIGDSLLGQNREQVDGVILKAMDFTTRTFSRAVTQWVLLFGPINMLRDVDEKSKLIRTRDVKDQAGNPINVNQVFKGTWKNALNPETWRAAYALAFDPNHRASNATQIGRWSNELIEDGGVSTWGENTRRGLETIRQGVEREAKLAGFGRVDQKMAENVKEWIARYNLMFEVVSSLSVNAAMREMGVEREVASAATLDLMNFSNVGAKTRWARAAFAFFNPAVQSGANIFRQLATPRGKRDLLILMVVSGFIQGLMRMFGDDDPELGAELDQRGTWELDRNVPIKLFGVPLKLPVGFGLSQLAWGWTNSLARLMSGRYSAGDALSQAAVSALKTFNPLPIAEVPPTKQPVNFLAKTFTPTAFRPLIDMATDTDAWGSKLTTYYPDKSKMRAEQGKVGTPQTYKQMARSLTDVGIDVYPEHVRSIIESVALGPVGYAWQSYVDSNKEAEGRRLNALDKIPGSSLLRITGASRLVGGTSRYLEARYYEKMDTLLAEKRQLNQAKSMGREGEWRREHPDAIRRIDMVQAHETEMRELSKEFNSTMRDLQSDKVLFGVARHHFERISNQREKAMREFLRKQKDPMWNVDAIKGVTP